MQFDTEAFTAEVDTIEWSLSQQAAASLESASGRNCNVAISTVTDTEVIAILTCSVTFVGGRIMTGTKSISICAEHTLPSRLVISGSNDIAGTGTYNYTLEMEGEYTAALQSVQWSLNRRSISIQSQDEHGCTLLVTSMPVEDTTMELSCVATFEGNRQLTQQFAILIEAATTPSTLTVSGPSSASAVDTYNYQAAFDTEEFTARVTDIEWSITEQAYASIDSSNMRARVTVASLPSADVQLTVQCVVTFSNGTQLTGTKQLTLAATTIPTALNITGDALLNAAGAYNYSKAFVGEYTAELLSIVWGLTQSENASISTQSDNAATVNVSTLPEDGDVTLTLSCTATFSGNRTVVGTKALTLSQRQYTYPNSVTINGAAAFAAAGSQQYTKAFDTDNFDAEVLNVEWLMNLQDAAVFTERTDNSATLMVDTMPERSVEVILTVRVTMTRNVQLTDQKTITVSAATYAQLAINGAAEFSSAGSQTYEAALSGSYTAVVQSHAWSLSQQSVATLASSSDAQAVISVAELPAAATQLTLTHSVTYTNGHVQTETKSITVSAATYNTYSLSGANEIADRNLHVYSRALLTEGNVPVVSEEWQAAAPLQISTQSTSQVEVQVPTMPTTATTAALSHIVTYADGHTETDTKSIAIAAATYPDISINGADEINEAGNIEYSRVISGSHASDYTAIIQSSVWSLSQSENASITSQTATAATIAVAAIPETAEILTLTLTVTFTDSHVITATKSISLQESVAPADLVDLGLPSGKLWAKGNIVKDANGNYSVGEESDYGCYFSWGNIVGHNDSENYNFSTSNYNSTPGRNINTIISSDDLEHNAALACLGGSWNLPSDVDFKELVDNTDISYVKINDVNGIKFQKKTDHSIYIFLPYAGSYNGTSLNNRGSEGIYWSNKPINTTYAYIMRMSNSQLLPQNDIDRYRGISIRAVQSPS